MFACNRTLKMWAQSYVEAVRVLRAAASRSKVASLSRIRGENRACEPWRRGACGSASLHQQFSIGVTASENTDLTAELKRGLSFVRREKEPSASKELAGKSKKAKRK